MHDIIIYEGFMKSRVLVLYICQCCYNNCIDSNIFSCCTWEYMK